MRCGSLGVGRRADCRSVPMSVSACFAWGTLICCAQDLRPKRSTVGDTKPPARRVLIVRHGQTTWNKAGRFQGQNDSSELNAVGVQQARRLARMLAAEKFQIKRIYVSPLQRARQTLDAMVDEWDELIVPARSVQFEPLLKEIRLPWEGLDKQNLPEEWRTEYVRFKADVAAYKYASSENDTYSPVGDVWSRAEAFWGLLRAQQRFALSDEWNADPECVLVIAHNHTNKALLASALGWPCVSGRHLAIDQDNACLNVLDFDHNGNACMQRLNQVASGDSHIAQQGECPPSPSFSGTTKTDSVWLHVEGGIDPAHGTSVHEEKIQSALDSIVRIGTRDGDKPPSRDFVLNHALFSAVLKHLLHGAPIAPVRSNSRAELAVSNSAILVRRVCV
ncbi:putative 2-carboxy-D-arabinitol-1-phosphatase [Porphyridium purpureum]|uniref:Putative 2-carboxy-D-arabinitol-1-phosphatase n=1 Tax=Porphyridium purpureum TaxID=35688 RepID=A0A5J4Z2L5_PORPP|nr:putative 2-carboxy-D-arabinitol-1-phosphatase [Porphyridium purpureum]|eukprot:POR8994..scf208_2